MKATVWNIYADNEKTDESSYDMGVRLKSLDPTGELKDIWADLMGENIDTKSFAEVRSIMKYWKSRKAPEWSVIADRPGSGARVVAHHTASTHVFHLRWGSYWYSETDGGQSPGSEFVSQ